MWGVLQEGHIGRIDDGMNIWRMDLYIGSSGMIEALELLVSRMDGIPRSL
jgi:hypothetical protein